MLNLRVPTSDRWFEHVSQHLDELLIDHAHCEKKAAGTAMNLIFYYVDCRELCESMTEIVNEELSHFHLVLKLMDERNIRFRRIKPSGYGGRLHELIRRQEPQRAVDRLLVAGLIEARSCERFGILRDRLQDPQLAAFYDSLFESEARHHVTYIQLARNFGAEAEVKLRLDELAEAEARIIEQGDDLPRMHS